MATGPSDRGTQMRPARPASPAATAAPTCAGVVASGAGSIPAVIRPMTNPGLTRSTRTPEPCSESASPRANASRPALAAPYTKFALRGLTAATDESITTVPCPAARIRAVSASSAVTWLVKLVSISVRGFVRGRVQRSCGREHAGRGDHQVDRAVRGTRPRPGPARPRRRVASTKGELP